MDFDENRYSFTRQIHCTLKLTSTSKHHAESLASSVESMVGSPRTGMPSTDSDKNRRNVETFSLRNLSIHVTNRLKIHDHGSSGHGFR